MLRTVRDGERLRAPDLRLGAGAAPRHVGVRRVPIRERYRRGTCFGDSGGPNFVGSSNVIAGVTSFGLNITCGGTGGVYRVMVGAGSRDIRLRHDVQLPPTS